MLYMQSYSGSDGTYTLTVTFKIGTDLNFAQVLVQNRVSSALSQLPQSVQNQGVTVQKRSTSILLFVTLTSPDKTFDSLYLSNYATINLRDELSRLPGVGNVTVFGAGQYSMRVWLDPNKLQVRGLVPQDVIQAIQQQSQQVSAGQVGAPPTPPGQAFQYTLNVNGRLDDTTEFENIIVKSGTSGDVTRVRDVGSVELGAQTYSQIFSLNKQPATGIGVFQSPGANALQVEQAVEKKMAELAKAFPQGMKYDTPFDTTKFVQASVHEVYMTLIEAGLLVLVVILVFLQDWRAMLVPATTVPVTIIGAFAAMAALGFTINMSTLFAIVLAIGIVVDDAIVVVEGAAHNIEQGMNGHDAAIKAMDQLFAPIVGITLVLISVFLPASFLAGLTGRIYSQFALVIAATALLSAINAATLKPTQCALWLRPTVPPEKRNFFYRGFNNVYDRVERGYTRLISFLCGHATVSVAFALVLIGIGGYGLSRVPTGFLPIEDQGYLIAAVQLPDGAALERTQKALDRASELIKDTPGVQQVITIAGISALDNSASLANAGVAYIILKDWDARKGPGEDLRSLVYGLNDKLAVIMEARTLVLPPPPIQGIGNAAGFSMQVELRDGNSDFGKLQAITSAMVSNGQSQSALQRVQSSFRSSVPQFNVEIDRIKTQDAARHDGPGVRGAVDLSRLVLCQPVQQVRPRVPGLYAGRSCVPPHRARHRQLAGAQLERRHDPDRHRRHDHAGHRPLADQSLQSLSLLDRHRPAGAGLLLGPVAEADGGDRGQDAAAGHRLRMDRDVLSGEGCLQPDLLGVRARHAAGLSRPRRPIRELVRADLGDPRGAAVADRAHADPQWPEDRQQSLLPDRSDPPDRAVGQERHPDRRGRAGAARPRWQAGAGIRHRGCARPLSTDPDDVVRLHPRRRAAGDRDRRRRQRAQVDRHHGVLGHAGLDMPCGAVRAGLLRGGATLRELARVEEGAEGCGGDRGEVLGFLGGGLPRLAA
ncbi:preprotein translocase subunit SecF [Bradyrhizobium sp. LM6.10]